MPNKKLKVEYLGCDTDPMDITDLTFKINNKPVNVIMTSQDIQKLLGKNYSEKFDQDDNALSSAIDNKLDYKDNAYKFIKSWFKI